MKNINATFSKRLKRLREEKKMNYAKLATELNVSSVSLGYYERGERLPNIETVMNMAIYFGVTTDYLIGVSDFRYIGITSDQEAYAKLYEEYEAYKKRVDRTVEKATISLNGSIIDLNDLVR